MTVYTYSQARQNFATVLNKARDEGEVLIKRKDGQFFVLKPEMVKKSPLDVKGIAPFLNTKELIDIIREQKSAKKY
jgi:hypothetical protein